MSVRRRVDKEITTHSLVEYHTALQSAASCHVPPADPSEGEDSLINNSKTRPRLELQVVFSRKLKNKQNEGHDVDECACKGNPSLKGRVRNGWSRMQPPLPGGGRDGRTRTSAADALARRCRGSVGVHFLLCSPLTRL